VTVFQSDRLLVKAGIADDCRRDLRFIGLDNADAIFGEVLGTQMERIAVNNPFDHRRIEET
jgi:hypothetical protein